MRAARYHGREDVRVEDVEEPPVGPDDVRIRVAFAGICGSDLHEFYAGPHFTRADEPHPLTGVRNPVVLGHELAGTVVEVGAAVTTVQPGALVSVRPVEPCGSCDACRAGERCPNGAIHGYTRASGAFAEHTLARESMVHPLPDGMDPQLGALVEPMSVGFTSAVRADVADGETVAVHGLGPIGIGAAIALQARGCRVIGVDPSRLRRDALQAVGFPDVVDPLAGDAAGAIRALTDGAGVHASIDCAGAPAALAAAIASTRPDRRVVLTAFPPGDLQIDVAAFHRSRVLLTACPGGASITVAEAFDGVIDLMAEGAYDMTGWIDVIGLDDVVAQGFEPLHRQERIKTLIALQPVAL